MTTSEKLVKFVNQRPGLDFCNYGNIRSYRSEMREITADRQDFFELFSFAQMRINDFEQKLTKELKNTTGRLTLEGDSLQYITGQYFPTEFRPAANRVLVSLLWNEYRDEKNEAGQPVYQTGDEIRKAIKRNLNRRVSRLYFR